MDIIAQHGGLFILLACLFGFFMAWGVGANDVANAMGTSVGSKAITIRQAILIAVVFEFLGAWLAGGEVTATIRKGIIDPTRLDQNPQYLIYGMLSSLLAAAVWLMVASRKGWPVSTTHSIVGAIVGFAIAGLGASSVQWAEVGRIASSWVTSPMVAGVLAFLLFRSIQALIFENRDPLAAARRYVPAYMFLVGFIIAMVTLLKGLSHVGFNPGFVDALLWSMGAGAVVTLLGIVLERRIGHESKRKERFSNEGERFSNGKESSSKEDGRFAKKEDRFRFSGVERIFGVLMMFTACAMAFAHGSNDVANAVGPLAAVISVVQNQGEIGASAMLPWWVLILGGGGIVAGLVTYGRRVIATVGTGITELTPSRGFAATLAAATTVVIASGTGIPISTTHTLVGAVLGVGLARGMRALNLRVLGTIVISWLVTLPAGAGLSIMFFFMLKGMFG